MTKPTVASLNSEVIDLRQTVAGLVSTIASLEAMIREIPGKDRGAAAPVAPAVAINPAVVAKNRPGNGLHTPTCISCKVKCPEPGVPLRPHGEDGLPGAIGYRCYIPGHGCCPAES